MRLFKDIFDKTTIGKGLKQALGKNEIDKNFGDVTIYDPENENKIYDIGKAYEKNFFPNGLKNSPLEKPEHYDNQKETVPSPDKSSLIAPNKYVGMFNQNHRPETDILLKSAQNTGENEINAARKFTMFDNKDQALGKVMNERISSWYDTMYGTNPMQRDASGRQIEPAAKMQAQPMPPRTKDGLDLVQGLGKLSQQMAAVDADDSAENGISALQKNLNVLGAEPALKVDSILGPKTALQARRYLADNGYSSLDKAFRNKLYAG